MTCVCVSQWRLQIALCWIQRRAAGGDGLHLQSPPPRALPGGERTAGSTRSTETAASRRSRSACGTWAWASTRTRSCCSSTAWARARAPGATTTWPSRPCWRTAACPTGRSAPSPAAGPPATRPCPSWTLGLSGRPSGGSQPPTAAVWVEEESGERVYITHQLAHPAHQRRSGCSKRAGPRPTAPVPAVEPPGSGVRSGVSAWGWYPVCGCQVHKPYMWDSKAFYL